MAAPPTSRERILDAARDLFEQDGAEGLSMRKVAAKVGLTPMAIYRHFADKDALMDALALDGLEAWRARLAALPQVEAMAWLEAMTDAFLDFWLEEPRRFEAAFLLRARAARQFPDDFAAGKSPPGQLWRARLHQARAEGKLDPAASSLEIGFNCWALAQGLITLYRAGRFTGGLDAFREFYRRACRRLVGAYVLGDNP